MRAIQNSKIVPAILPGVIKDNAAFVSRVIDLADFEGCDYLEFQGMIGAADISLTALKVMQSDTKTDSVTLGGSPTLVKDSTTKPGASDDSTVFVFGIDLRKPRERFLQLQATAGDGTAGIYLCAQAVGLPAVSSSLASDRGLLFAEYA